MKTSDVQSKAFAMPLTSPAFPLGPYRFVDREFLIITCRTDPARLREIVPEPLQITEPIVHDEFIRMADSTGFGDYTESGQVIPVGWAGRSRPRLPGATTPTAHHLLPPTIKTGVRA